MIDFRYNILFNSPILTVHFTYSQDFLFQTKTEWIWKFTFPICSSWLRATHSLGTYTEQYTIHFGVLWCFTDNFIKMSKCKLNRKLYLNLMCNSNLPEMVVENLLEAKAKNQAKAKRITTWNSFMWKWCRDITIHLH